MTILELRRIRNAAAAFAVSSLVSASPSAEIG
jgi:hypothetical protein